MAVIAPRVYVHALTYVALSAGGLDSGRSSTVHVALYIYHVARVAVLQAKLEKIPKIVHLHKQPM